MTKIWWPFVFLAVSLSCNKAGHSFKAQKTDTPEIKSGVAPKPSVKKFTKAQILKGAAKNHQIYDCLEISKNVIILIRRSHGLELSVDNGRTWEWIGKELPAINEITVDDKGVWWALERWKGIHESSYSVIIKSTDFGKTWKQYVFDTSVFFPYHIYSKPHEPLAITTFSDNKVYRQFGADVQKDWKFIKQLSKEDDFAEVSAGNYHITRKNDDNKLYVKRKGGVADTLMDFKKAYNIYDIKKVKNKLFIAGPSGGGDYDNSYFAIITYENKRKEFKIPGVDLNIRVTQSNRVFLLCSSGAYRLDGDKLNHIYK